ncbi:uncharacterized, partial [Tachysurus ichikawai]
KRRRDHMTAPHADELFILLMRMFGVAAFV